MDLTNVNLNLNSLVLAGMPVVVLVFLAVQMVKEVGVPSKILPSCSVLAAALFLALRAYAPANAQEIVSGSVMLGGLTTFGYRFVKDGSVSGAIADVAQEAEQPAPEVPNGRG